LDNCLRCRGVYVSRVATGHGDLRIDNVYILSHSTIVNSKIETCLSSFSAVSRTMPQTSSISRMRRHTALLSLLTLAIPWLIPFKVHASLPLSSKQVAALTSLAAAPNGGFWVQVDLWNGSHPRRGETLFVDGAPDSGNLDRRGSIAAIPGRDGYWIVTATGEIQVLGTAPDLCNGRLTSCSGYPQAPIDVQAIVAAAATPAGDGLWAVGHDGAVWTAGNAQSYGDVQFDSAVPTGIVATPSGKGYYIVMDNGGVFTFGDAIFYGSTGGNRPGGDHVDLTGIALSIGDDGQVNGYWLVGSDGGVFNFGEAPFWGSTGGNNGGSPVTNIVSFPAPVPGQPPQATKGYAWVHKDGRVGKATVDEPR
jgi:hypothetical protein